MEGPRLRVEEFEPEASEEVADRVALVHLQTRTDIVCGSHMHRNLYLGKGEGSLLHPGERGQVAEKTQAAKKFHWAGNGGRFARLPWLGGATPRRRAAPRQNPLCCPPTPLIFRQATALVAVLGVLTVSLSSHTDPPSHTHRTDCACRYSKGPASRDPDRGL